MNWSLRTLSSSHFKSGKLSEQTNFQQNPESRTNFMRCVILKFYLCSSLLVSVSIWLVIIRKWSPLSHILLQLINRICRKALFCQNDC